MKARLVIEYTHALVALEESRLEAGSPLEKLRAGLVRILARPLPSISGAAGVELAEARAAIRSLFESEIAGRDLSMASIDRVRARLATLAREAVGDP
jgi:hypothetical protein